MSERGAVVVTVAHGRHEHLSHQLRLLAQSDPGVAHVVVAVADPAIATVARLACGSRQVTVVEHPGDPRGLPIAAARNHGVAEALAMDAAVVVLLDVDCLAAPDAIARYASVAANVGQSILCGPVTYLPQQAVPPADPGDLRLHRCPHPARPDPHNDIVRGGDHALFWSLSAAFTPATWERLGGFCEDYVGYGGEDTDLGRVARREGVDLVWVGGADAYHQYHPVSSPPVEHLEAIVRNAQVFYARWGAWPMTGWLAAFADEGLIHWGTDALEIARG